MVANPKTNAYADMERFRSPNKVQFGLLLYQQALVINKMISLLSSINAIDLISAVRTMEAMISYYKDMEFNGVMEEIKNESNEEIELLKKKRMATSDAIHGVLVAESIKKYEAIWHLLGRKGMTPAHRIEEVLE